MLVIVSWANGKEEYARLIWNTGIGFLLRRLSFADPI
jgi:hypothetical protein